jgi:hypothetical protein
MHSTRDASQTPDLCPLLCTGQALHSKMQGRDRADAFTQVYVPRYNPAVALTQMEFSLAAWARPRRHKDDS